MIDTNEYVGKFILLNKYIVTYSKKSTLGDKYSRRQGVEVQYEAGEILLFDSILDETIESIDICLIDKNAKKVYIYLDQNWERALQHRFEIII